MIGAPQAIPEETVRQEFIPVPANRSLRSVGSAGWQMAFDESQSDVALVERVKAGDVRAFETLHRRYYPRVYRFALLKLGSPEDAADIAGTTFCRALRSLPGFVFRRGVSLYPWLHQIASNLVIDLVRDRPPGGSLSLDAQAADDVDSFLNFLPSSEPSAQELVEREEVQQLVFAAVRELPADQGRAIHLRFVADLSIREIAQALDRTEGAVKSLLHRALEGVRHRLRADIKEAHGVGQHESGAVGRRQGKANDDATEHIRLRNGDA